MLHYPIAILIIRILGKNTAATAYNFWTIYIPAVILTIVLSCVTKIIMEATILKKK